MKEQQQKIFVSGHLTDPTFFYLTLNFFWPHSKTTKQNSMVEQMTQQTVAKN